MAGERIDALYTSDLARAAQTAEAARRYPDWYTRWREGTVESYPGGEQFSDLRDRALGAFDRIADRHAGQTALAVCHNGIVRAIVLHVLGLEPGARPRIAPGPNCSLTVVERQRRRLVLVALNDVGHLDGLV